MNGNDIFDSLSGIDPKYIDEAAYELHGREDKGDSEPENKAKVVDITSKTARNNLRRFVTVVLPAVAVVLLIVGVALPAILRTSKSESSAPMAESAAPAASETAAEAPAEADEAVSMDEAAPMEEAAEAEAEAEEPVSNAPVAEASEAPAAENTYDADMKNRDEVQTLGPESTAEKAEDHWEIREAKYRDGVLTLWCYGTIPDDLTDMTYNLTRLDVAAEKANVEEGEMSKLSDRIEIDDDLIVINMSDNKLESGRYRIFIGDVYCDFEVKQ